MVDVCLGLKGATRLYGLLGRGEKEKPAGENPLIARRNAAKQAKQAKREAALAKQGKLQQHFAATTTASDGGGGDDKEGVVRLPPMGVILKDAEDANDNDDNNDDDGGGDGDDKNKTNKKKGAAKDDAVGKDRGNSAGEEVKSHAAQDEAAEEEGGGGGGGDAGNDNASLNSTDEQAKAMGLPALVSYKDLLAALDPDEDTLKLLVHDLTRKAMLDKDRLKEERDKVHRLVLVS